MLTVLDTQCYPVLQKNFDLANVSIEDATLSRSCERAVQTFYEIAKKALIQSLANGVSLNTVKVPIMVTNLSLKEREELEDVLYRHGHWSVFCGDRFIIVFTPTHGLKDPQGTQFTYLVKTGKICPNCSVFTVRDEMENKWSCPSCGRSVSAYADHEMAMGQVATLTERKHRIDTHKVLDRLWKEGFLQRKEVYKELSEVLGIPRQYTHVAMIDDKLLPIVNTWAEARYNQLVNKRLKKETYNDKSVQVDECGGQAGQGSLGEDED